jgi:hypothetical protein
MGYSRRKEEPMRYVIAALFALVLLAAAPRAEAQSWSPWYYDSSATRWDWTYQPQQLSYTPYSGYQYQYGNRWQQSLIPDSWSTSSRITTPLYQSGYARPSAIDNLVSSLYR